jgi:putative ABC transport system permease protein
MMLNLFKENVRIAFVPLEPNITYLAHRINYHRNTALVGILTVVSALENTIFLILHQWELPTSNNTKTTTDEERTRNYKPYNVSYPEAVDFKNKYDYPLRNFLSFTATSTAEVKYDKTDPEIAVVGVDEYFMTNSV